MEQILRDTTFHEFHPMHSGTKIASTEAFSLQNCAGVQPERIPMCRTPCGAMKAGGIERIQMSEKDGK